MNKVKLMLTTIFAGSLLGCGPDLVPVAISNFKTSNQLVMEQVELLKKLNPDIKNVFNIDLKGGQKNTGSFALSIQSESGNDKIPDFQVQNSSDGSQQKTKSNIQGFQVILISSATSPPAGLVTPAHGPFNVPTNFPGAGSSTIITFTDVTAGNYFACVGAFDNNITMDNATNITSTTASHYYNGGGHCYMSNGGGEGGSPGRVTIGGGGAVTGVAPLTVTVNLTDIRGAKVQTDITVNDGV